MPLLEKMVVLEKLDGARGWHPNLAKTQLSGNPGSGEAISRKRDEGPRKKKKTRRGRRRKTCSEEWILLRSDAVSMWKKELIETRSGETLKQWFIWMAAGRSFGLKHFMTSAGFPTSGMKQEVWSTDSSNTYIHIIVRYFVKRGQPTKHQFYSRKKQTLKKLSYLWQFNYLNYCDSSNSPFSIKRKVSWKCVSWFSCKNLCFVGEQYF